MPEVIEVTIFKFDELSEKAQERAIEDHRDWELDFEWWDCVYADAMRMGTLMGIVIDTINFTGFWSQGDGACFSGRYMCEPDAVEGIRRETSGKDAELLRIASRLTELQVTLKVEHGCTFECRVNTTTRYCHSGTMHVDEWNVEDFDTEADVPVKDFLDLLRHFADWIYDRLEAEHEYLTSDEHIREILTDSDLRFDEDGSTI